MDDCKYHYDHESRIKRMETLLQKVEDAKVNPGWWLGLFSFLGIVFATVGNILGRLWIP